MYEPRIHEPLEFIVGKLPSSLKKEIVVPDQRLSYLNDNVPGLLVGVQNFVVGYIYDYIHTLLVEKQERVRDDPLFVKMCSVNISTKVPVGTFIFGDAVVGHLYKRGFRSIPVTDKWPLFKNNLCAITYKGDNLGKLYYQEDKQEHIQTNKISQHKLCCYVGLVLNEVVDMKIYKGNKQ